MSGKHDSNLPDVTLDAEPPERDDGGPAFPRVEHRGETDTYYHGMSVRDYFAAAALPAVAYASMQALKVESCAVACYEFADAMLKARGEFFAEQMHKRDARVRK